VPDINIAKIYDTQDGKKDDQLYSQRSYNEDKKSGFLTGHRGGTNNISFSDKKPPRGKTADFEIGPEVCGFISHW
jgi:hypothetical protein